MGLYVSCCEEFELHPVGNGDAEQCLSTERDHHHSGLSNITLMRFVQ